MWSSAVVDGRKIKCVVLKHFVTECLKVSYQPLPDIVFKSSRRVKGVWYWMTQLDQIYNNCVLCGYYYLLFVTFVIIFYLDINHTTQTSLHKNIKNKSTFALCT